MIHGRIKVQVWADTFKRWKTVYAKSIDAADDFCLQMRIYGFRCRVILK
jgi:hypothetical protein